jgi:hypothetical protein
VHFQVQDLHRTLFFTDGEIVLSSPSARPAAEAVAQGTIFDAAPPSEVVRVRFAGAHPTPTITGAAALPGIVNYFIGNTPTQWRTGVPTYAGVMYHDLYPGVDVHYDGTAGRLKGTYIVAPGADPERIRWNYVGAHRVALDGATGDL